ncbi:hypothetical protein EGH57_18900 [Klebsiella aerogenes]|nr:hypothetical protein EGH57_18900 [Klebsiella aerogenes]
MQRLLQVIKLDLTEQQIQTFSRTLNVICRLQRLQGSIALIPVQCALEDLIRLLQVIVQEIVHAQTLCMFAGHLPHRGTFQLLDGSLVSRRIRQLGEINGFGAGQPGNGIAHDKRNEQYSHYDKPDLFLCNSWHHDLRP